MQRIGGVGRGSGGFLGYLVTKCALRASKFTEPADHSGQTGFLELTGITQLPGLSQLTKLTEQMSQCITSALARC